MNKVYDVFMFLLQFFSAFVTIFILYLFHAVWDYKGGFTNFIGLTFFQPIIGFFFSTFSILFFTILGLPLRLNSKLRIWWKRHFYLAVFFIFIGFVAFILAFMPFFVEQRSYEDDELSILYIKVPNGILTLIAWVLISFGILHVYPPPIVEKYFLIGLNQIKVKFRNLFNLANEPKRTQS